MNRTSLLAASLVLAVACAEDARTAEGAQLLVPEAVQVEWDDQFSEADDVGLLVPVDLMVFEGSSGEPLDFVRVTVGAEAGAQVLELDAVEMVPTDCDDCVWDAGRDRYVVLPADGAPAADRTVLTDADGMARIYVWIDAFPTDEDGDLLPIAIDADTDVSGATFDIVGN